MIDVAACHCSLMPLQWPKQLKLGHVVVCGRDWTEERFSQVLNMPSNRISAFKSNTGIF
jgi:hypothetical protein